MLSAWMRSVCKACCCLLVQAILASGYYAAFRVTLVARALEGVYDGAVHITTDYQVRTPLPAPWGPPCSAALTPPGPPRLQGWMPDSCPCPRIVL